MAGGVITGDKHGRIKEIKKIKDQRRIFLPHYRIINDKTICRRRQIILY